MNNQGKSITITSRDAIAILVGFIFLVVAIFAFGPKVAALVTAPSSAETAARAGAEAFLSTDYEKGQSAWESAICAVSSEQGCALTKATFAPMIWRQVMANSVRKFCQATNAVRTGDSVSADNKERRQTWQVTLSCLDPDGNKSKGEVTSIVIEDANGWKFERLAFSEEGQK